MSGHPKRTERAVLNSLMAGQDERFALAPFSAGAVKVALQASLQTEDAICEVRRLLQLIAALDGPLESPTAAEALRNVIRADPDATALIPQSSGSRRSP